MTQKHQIQLFEEKKVRSVWDDDLQEWFFSVADVVEVLTDSVDVKQYIKKMRKRDPELDARWGTICTPTRMQAADGSRGWGMGTCPSLVISNLYTYSLVCQSKRGMVA